MSSIFPLWTFHEHVVFFEIFNKYNIAGATGGAWTVNHSEIPEFIFGF